MPGCPNITTTLLRLVINASLIIMMQLNELWESVNLGSLSEVITIFFSDSVIPVPMERYNFGTRLTLYLSAAKYQQDQRDWRLRRDPYQSIEKPKKVYMPKMITYVVGKIRVLYNIWFKCV